MDSKRRKSKVAWLSVISNTSLVLLKLVVGLLIGSVSVISEAIHSGIDLLAAVIALLAVKASGKPADETHRFGHGKVESISGAIEAVLIFLAAAWIIFEAIKKLLHPQEIELVGLGVGVMLLSALVNIVVSHALFRVGKDTDSLALLADAWHLRTDVYTSAGVMGCLTVILVCRWFVPSLHLQWLDPITAIAVALFIIRAAWKLTFQAASELMDVSLPADEESLIREHVVKLQPIVRGFHDLRTRRVGNTRFVEFHMLVEPNMSVEDSHHVADEIADSIEQHFPNSSVTVHVEPCDGKCDQICYSGCLITEEERNTMRQKEGLEGDD